MKFDNTSMAAWQLKRGFMTKGEALSKPKTKKRGYI
jgi:hypothetical protein